MENSGMNPLAIDVDAISRELHIGAEALKRIIISFSKTLSEKMTELGAAFERNDVIRMRAILHEIRGTSGNLRLAKIYSTTVTLHEAVKANEERGKLQQYFDSLKLYSQELTNYAKNEESKNAENINR